MKKILTIIAAAVGYLLIEAFVVLVIARETGLPELQFLTTTAMMVSAFFFGGETSAWRALKIVLVTIAAVPVAVIVAIPAVMSLRLDLPSLLSESVFIALVLAPPLVVFFFSRKLSDRQARVEAERWLSDRDRYGLTKMRQRSRYKRVLLTVPSISVLGFLFFWAPVQGALTRPTCLLSGSSPQYQISIPLSWTRLCGYQRDDYIGLLRLGKMAPAALTLGRIPATMSLTQLNFSSTPDPDRTAAKLMDRDRNYAADLRVHALSSARVPFDCWDFKWKYHMDWYPEFRSASCVTNDGRLRADFNGDRRDLESFYQMISTVEFRK